MIFVAIVAYFAYKMVRRGGLRGALFDATVSDTLGEVATTGPKLVNQILKVHTLDRNGEPLIGIEIVSKTFASYQMLPVTLTPSQAQQLLALLQRALVHK